MANYKKLISLDPESMDILKGKTNQSKYVRDSLKNAHIKELNEQKKPEIKVNPHAKIEVRLL